MNKEDPIGIFDSGIGGLSIGLAIKDILPHENLMYFADIAFAPYGIKSQHTIQDRCEHIVEFLISKGCKAVVVACNTATVTTINKLRQRFDIPIIGVEPGIKPAALQSKTGVIGVLATKRTLASDSFNLLKSRYSQQVQVHTVACTEFVTLVEKLETHSDNAVAIAKNYIQPLLKRNSDQLVLGCTHFSFLKRVISEISGDTVTIIDTSTPVALELKRRLKNTSLLNQNSIQGQTEFWTSKKTNKLLESIQYFWKQEIIINELKTQ